MRIKTWLICKIKAWDAVLDSHIWDNYQVNAKNKKIKQRKIDKTAQYTLNICLVFSI